MLLVGCQTGLKNTDPGLTKRQVVSRIGLPAEIYLGIFSGSAPEMLKYDEEDPSGKVDPKILNFSDGRLRLGRIDINPRRLLNPDKPEDFAKNAAYEWSLQEPKKR